MPRGKRSDSFPTSRGPRPERCVTGAGALPNPKQAPRNHQHHPSLKNQPLSQPAAPAAGAVTHVRRQQRQQRQQPQPPQPQPHHSQRQSQPRKQSRLSSGSYGGATDPCVRRAPSVHRSGSYGAHGSKRGSSSSDGDMWTCLTRLFRVDVFKNVNFRHWLKTGSWKDVSSAASHVYACMHIASAARAR